MTGLTIFCIFVYLLLGFISAFIVQDTYSNTLEHTFTEFVGITVAWLPILLIIAVKGTIKVIFWSIIR